MFHAVKVLKSILSRMTQASRSSTATCNSIWTSALWR